LNRRSSLRVLSFRALFDAHERRKSMDTRPSRASSPDQRPKLIIDERVYPRLVALAERARVRVPELADRLLEEIERADLRSLAEMPPDVVTLGSEVTYRHDEKTETVHIVAPEDADIDRRRISVLTPVGAALLGLQVGQRIGWEMPDKRTAVLEVVSVRQPRDGTQS
jgi:regulator of nucleoside diphosphate kinase